MKTVRVVAILLLVSSLLPAQAAQKHDKDFWKAIIVHDFAVPEGTKPTALAEELKAYLDSPDPEWRDDIAATIFTAWIAQKETLPADEVVKLSNEWSLNLRAESYSQSDITVGRTFSALMLGIAIYRDNHTPIFDEAQYRHILQSAFDYLASEKDLRGYDPRLGWVHATAHTADLLKFSARSRYFTKQDQATLLDAIRTRMKTASVVFVRGEDERLARAILSVVNRADFDADGFHAWAQAVKTDIAFPKEITVQALDHRQNLVNLLSKLEVITAEQPEAAKGPKRAMQELLVVLKTAY